MTSTLPPDPPNFPGINYNSSFWSNASTTGLTYNQALKNFLTFPVAQGTETLQNTNVNGTMTIINPLSPSETYSQYIDNDPSYDMTLSTTQTAGGLTIRTPTNSFTMNPKTFNINLTTPTPVTGLQMLNPINMANFNIVNMGQYSTAYTQANNTNLDYVATCNYVNNMIVNGNGILDNNNVWTGTNEFQNTVSVTSNNGVNIGAYGNLSNSSVLNQNFVIQNKYQNDTAQIYFQMFNSAGVAQTPMNFTPTAVYCNLPLNLTNSSDLNMGSNDINNCASINPPASNYVTTTTPPNGDNSTKIATTSWVYNNLPALTNFAQLTYSPLQTFTGAISMNGTFTSLGTTTLTGNITSSGSNNWTGNNNFSTSLTYKGTTVATLAQLPTSTNLSISTIVVTYASLISGSAQQSIYTPSTLIGQFVSYPFTIQVNQYVAVNDILTYIAFNTFPFPNWPPASNGQISGLTVGSGGANNFNYTWGTYSGTPYIAIYMAYNVGTGNQVIFNLASLGPINTL